MSSQSKIYCHITGKKIRINDVNKAKKISFEPENDKSICSVDLKVCDGNCNGCNLL